MSLISEPEHSWVPTLGVEDRTNYVSAPAQLSRGTHARCTADANYRTDYTSFSLLPSAAWPAASRATGTRKGEQET